MKVSQRYQYKKLNLKNEERMKIIIIITLCFFSIISCQNTKELNLDDNFKWSLSINEIIKIFPSDDKLNPSNDQMLFRSSKEINKIPSNRIILTSENQNVLSKLTFILKKESYSQVEIFFNKKESKHFICMPNVPGEQVDEYYLGYLNSKHGKSAFIYLLNQDGNSHIIKSASLEIYNPTYKLEDISTYKDVQESKYYSSCSLNE